MQPDVSLSQKKLKLRGFYLEKFIGKGAFSNVYACRRNFSRKKYAAKIVEFNGDNKLKWETENEIEVLQRLSHWSVVRLHGALRDNERTILILEYIDGPMFLDGIISWPHFCENDVKIVMKQLLSVLEFCHEKRIVHRDLCPENIMWADVPSASKQHASPLLKLIDFNLARNIPEHSTCLRADPLGNPSYMAPECLQDTPTISFGTDVWAAGVIMYTLLAGYPPFWNDNYNHLLQNISEANFVTPDDLWNHVTYEGKNMIGKILCKDTLQRPSTGELLSSKWFQNTLRDESTEWTGHTRLIVFLNHLAEKRKKKNHRTYKLTYTERKAFVPAVSMISQPLQFDVNNNKECWTNSNNKNSINSDGNNNNNNNINNKNNNRHIKVMLDEIKSNTKMNCHW